MTDAVVDYLRTQAAVIADRAGDVRVDAPDAVHRSRVATRRSRSALRTFVPLFKRRRVRALRNELAWHADHLGAPRDAEVLKERDLLFNLVEGQAGNKDILFVKSNSRMVKLRTST